jgi:hypothetical protein
VAKSAAVTTNDAAYPTFNLLLRAHFKPVAVEPVQPNAPPKVFSEAGKRVGSLSIAPIDRWTTTAISGSTSVTTMYIYSHEGKPVHIKSVESGGTAFTYKLQPIAEGKRYELVVATDRNLKPGKYEQTMKVMTDSPDTPVISVPLEVTVYPHVFVMPTSMTLQPMPVEIDLSTIALPVIDVRKIRGDGLQIKTVHSTLPFLRVNLTTEVDGQSYKIKLTIDKSRTISKGEFKGVIRIETNDPDAAVIEVPIQGSFN